MRVGTTVVLVPVFVLAGCASATVGSSESVRGRLEDSETQLLITTAESTGSITAQRRTSEGWIAGTVALTVEGGELVATADGRGAITIERLAIDVGTIEIPPSVLGYEAQITDARLEARRPVRVVTTWIGDDAVHATAELDLELTWSLTIEGEASPLGAPKLMPVPIELELTGDGAAVHAEVHVAAAGTFWSWADLVRLEDLRLVLGASTVVIP